jgi:hypothetical protein
MEKFIIISLISVMGLLPLANKVPVITRPGGRHISNTPPPPRVIPDPGTKLDPGSSMILIVKSEPVN